jgi:hypothetical protein
LSLQPLAAFCTFGSGLGSGSGSGSGAGFGAGAGAGAAGCATRTGAAVVRGGVVVVARVVVVGGATVVGAAVVVGAVVVVVVVVARPDVPEAADHAVATGSSGAPQPPTAISSEAASRASAGAACRGTWGRRRVGAPRCDIVRISPVLGSPGAAPVAQRVRRWLRGTRA